MSPMLIGIDVSLRHELQSYEPNVKSQVYVLNARKVARFKKGYDTLPKNDRNDALVIADHLRFGRLPHEMKDIIQYEALQRLTRTRFHFNRAFFHSLCQRGHNRKQLISPFFFSLTSSSKSCAKFIIC